MYEELFNYCSSLSITYQATLYTRDDLTAEVFQPVYIRRLSGVDKSWCWLMEPFKFGDAANLLFDEASMTTILKVWQRISHSLYMVKNLANGHATQIPRSWYDQFGNRGVKNSPIIYSGTIFERPTRTVNSLQMLS